MQCVLSRPLYHWSPWHKSLVPAGDPEALS